MIAQVAKQPRYAGAFLWSNEMTIDARINHAPEDARRLVDIAAAAAGSKRELSARLGISERGLRDIYAGRARMSYVMQLALRSVGKR